MTDREIRLRRRIDLVTGELHAAIDRADTAERRLRALHSETGFLPGNHCVYCGAMSRFSVCAAHRDVARIDGWIGL